MTTPDYPDFAQPVAQVETDAQLLNAVSINSGGVTGQIDTSKFASVVVALDDDGAVAGTPRALVNLIWSVGAAVTWQDAVSFHEGAAYQFHRTPIWAQYPARGPKLNIQVFTEDGDPLKVSLYGSTRTVPDQRVTSLELGPGRLLLDTGNLVLAAGTTSATFRVPPVTKQLRYAATAFAVAQRISALGIKRDGGVLGSSSMYLKQTADTSGLSDDFDAPGIGTEWTIQNNDTSGHTVSFRVWDAS